MRTKKRASKRPPRSLTGAAGTADLIESGRIPPPLPEKEDGRVLDILDPGDLEEWLADKMNELSLLAQADLVLRIRTKAEAEIEIAQTAKGGLAKEDLRGDGYYDGQINAWATLVQQLTRAEAVLRANAPRGAPRDDA